jgi:hypothetical protein
VQITDVGVQALGDGRYAHMTLQHRVGVAEYRLHQMRRGCGRSPSMASPRLGANRAKLTFAPFPASAVAAFAKLRSTSELLEGDRPRLRLL